VSASTSDEVIQAFIIHAQEEENMVSHFPFQDFDDALFYDLESEEVSEETLDVLNPSCYDKDNDMVDNIDEFIHVGKCKWDVIGYDGDPIYDIKGHSICCLHKYHMRFLFILTFGNKEMT
jgi:hypothetical protein